MTGTEVYDLIPVGLRCHVEPTDPTYVPAWLRRSPATVARRANRLAAIDSEATTGATLTLPGFDPARWPPEAQALFFGRLHLYERDGEAWQKTSEILFYPDDLPSSALSELERIYRQDTRRMGDGREAADKPGVTVELVPLTSFRQRFFDECVRRPCLIVGFNLAFDLARIADGATRASRGRYGGGFGLIIWRDPKTGKPSKTHPRILVRLDDNGHAQLAFSSSRVPEKTSGKWWTWRTSSELLELRRLAYVLSGEILTLRQAAKDFGLPLDKLTPETHGFLTPSYVAYNRRDVDVTAALAVALLDEFDRHAFSRNAGGLVAETAPRSPAGLARGYLDLMRLQPRLTAQPDFPRAVLGQAMESFFGGLAINGARGELPITRTDVTSTFPASAVLMGHWPLWAAATVRIEVATDEIRRLLGTVNRADLLEPATWRGLNVLCLIEPDGDVLPTRGQYDPDSAEWTVSRGPVGTWPRPGWWPLPDVLASVVLNPEKTRPRLVRALRLVGDGVQDSLRPIRFRGVVPFDPSTQDFFKLLVGERAKVKGEKPPAPYDALSPSERRAFEWGLKLAVNSAAYGLLVEVNRRRPGYRQTPEVRVWTGSDEPGQGYFVARVPRLEENGRWYFPPLAALVTAGARLILALLQSLVTERGGTFAYSDTDSMTIASSQEGGIYQLPDGSTATLLTYAEVDEIQSTLDRLNPFDRSVIPHLLKIEPENYARNDPTKPRRELRTLAVSPKRHAEFIRAGTNRLLLVDWSDAALGSYLAPDERWRRRWWRGRLMNRPCPFTDVPAVKQFTIADWQTYERFARLNKGKPYQAQIKPFNFAMSVVEHGLGIIGPRRTLLAPYDPEPANWTTREWIDYATGQAHPISTDLAAPSALDRPPGWKRPVIVVGWSDVWRSYWPKAIPTTRDSEGRICTRDTFGLLMPRAIQPSRLVYLGKESVEIARAEVDLPTEEALIYRTEETADDWLTILRTLDDEARRYVAGHMNVSKSDFSQWMSGAVRPDARHLLEVTWHLEDYARATLSALGLAVPDHRANLFAVYSEQVPSAVDELREKIAAWVRREHQRRAASDLGVSQPSLAKKLSGKQEWPADEVIRWARQAGLLSTIDTSEDAEPVESHTDATEVSAET
jgi:transcriptional regulator with XRE-family HTH domain